MTEARKVFLTVDPSLDACRSSRSCSLDLPPRFRPKPWRGTGSGSGGAVMAAFPTAYAILLPALYAPIMIMLLGLVFRGVAFEFRFRSARRGRLWDASFVGGSVAASFMQGVALGAKTN